MKTALITGITGQDGAYLAKFLLGMKYRVVGVVRRTSAERNDERLAWLGIASDVETVTGDLGDLPSLIRIMRAVRPDEVYNLGAQSFVGASWDQPILTGGVNGLGAVNMLEAVLLACPTARFYQASSSEMFGGSTAPTQNESTPMEPRSPYAAAKLYAHWMTGIYRKSYGLHASSGILFNHESPLRGIEFVTRKVTDGVARIKLGLTGKLTLGNLDARRDWGHAADYVLAMWLMLQETDPGDYVVATGRSVSVREMVDIAFRHVGLDWQDYVEHSTTLDRPFEVDALCGDSRIARSTLGWMPTVTLEHTIGEMVGADLARLQLRPWR